MKKKRTFLAGGFLQNGPFPGFIPTLDAHLPGGTHRPLGTSSHCQPLRQVESHDVRRSDDSNRGAILPISAKRLKSSAEGGG